MIWVANDKASWDKHIHREFIVNHGGWVFCSEEYNTRVLVPWSMSRKIPVEKFKIVPGVEVQEDK